MDRKICIFIFCFFLLTLGHAQKVGERVYKPFALWDEVEYRWGECIVIDDYNLEGNVIISNTEIGITSYEYDDRGNLIHVKEPLTDTWSWYDDQNRLTIYKCSWRTATIEYSEKYKKTTLDDGDDGITVIEEYYDDFGNITKYKMEDFFDDGSSVYEYWKEYNKQGKEIKFRNNKGEETSFDYDQDEKLVSCLETKIDGDKTVFFTINYEYNSDGKLIAEKRSDGYEIVYEYDTEGDKNSSIDSNGVITKYNKDGHIIYYKDKKREYCEKIDSRGNVIYVKIDSSEWVDEYEYYPNGKRKTRKVYKLEEKK